MIEKSWLSMVKLSTDFLQIYLNTFNKDNNTKKLCFLKKKIVFINTSLYFSFL